MGEGDWSWVYGRPDEPRVVRLTPFDPAFLLFAAVAGRQPDHLASPRIHDVTTFANSGYAVTMERLEPVPRDAALVWLTALMARDPSAEPLMRFVRALELAVAESDLPLLVGLDLNPANVLRRPDSGDLVLTDALWIHGVRLFELVTTEPATALGLYTRPELTAYAHLPCMDDDGQRALLGALDSV